MKQEFKLRATLTAFAVIQLFICAPIWAAANSAAPLCASVFTSQIETPDLEINTAATLKKLENRSGLKVELKESQSDKGLIFLELQGKSGEPLGELNYRYIATEKTLSIVWMEATIKEVGISETLMTLALGRHPETTRIHTRALLDTNEAVVKAALEKGASIEDAIKATPAFKVRIKWGFDQIVPGSITSDFGFDVIRLK